jgi:hypothetical protein
MDGQGYSLMGISDVGQTLFASFGLVLNHHRATNTAVVRARKESKSPGHQEAQCSLAVVRLAGPSEAFRPHPSDRA